MPVVAKVFIGGGGDDTISHIVESYAEAYRRRNPTFQSRYFPWSANRLVRDHLQSLPADADISLVGHSYGADSAFTAIQFRPVTTLISIDPVGRFKTAWTRLRPRARVWLNVRAEPSAGRRTFDDVIAFIGGKYGRPPAAGEPGAPDYAYTVNTTHGRFAEMMRARPAGGVSGQMLLGGVPVD